MVDDGSKSRVESVNSHQSPVRHVSVRQVAFRGDKVVFAIPKSSLTSTGVEQRQLVELVDVPKPQGTGHFAAVVRFEFGVLELG